MFMRISYFITAAALMAASVIGCSKSSSQQPQQVNAPPKMTDLGTVEFTPNIPREFSLGAGRRCTLTGKQVSGGKFILVHVLIAVTNSDGSVQSSEGEAEQLPGRHCAFSITRGGPMIGFTPTLKEQ